MLYYIGIGLVIVLILNEIIIPFVFNQTVTEVDYSQFLTDLESGIVESVEIQDEEVAYQLIEGEGGDSFTTGRMDDPELVERLYAQDVEFTRVAPIGQSPLISFIFSWVLPLAIFIAIAQYFMKKMGDRMGGPNAMKFGKSNAKVYVEAETGKTFEDVAGQDEAKDALVEIIDYLKDSKKYREVGANIPKGALLVGPPGTGKTLLAKAVAGESSVPFFSISGSEFVEMFVGMGAARVRDLFKQAQEKAPCIVFIDEIDTIGKSRTGNGPGGNDEREQTLNQLLTEMDGFDQDKGVVILAASNRPETLDKALLRPGRFDRRIPVELPDVQGREAILKVHALKVKLADDVDLNLIARATSGASGADLANMINEAALRAVKHGRKVINQSDLEESVEVVIAGYQRKNAVISTKDKLTISYHEIGHALVAAKQTNAAPVHKITIIPRTSGALGYTMQIDQTEQVLYSKEQLLEKITTYMGGRAAEELIFDRITSGASNDIEQATKLARAMVTRYGMSSRFGMMGLETVSNQYLSGDTSLTVSDGTATLIDQEVEQIIRDCYQKALTILEENKAKLHELTKFLLEKETISGETFMNLLHDKIEA
ncbi:cell division protease FtsH [Amphibacillus marinus]|uniref:ATP-dependent zinc metalloprotease FtsH n=2 Tax=Amphibacillus marinus TaxID=872970 RepID=A0A1H8L6N3_9BACI|nr:cell division protease FtsH [Amphibacillus marinus]